MLRPIIFGALVMTSISGHANTFRFTAIPDQHTTRLSERFNKVAAYLAQELSIEVEYVPVKSYSASVAAFKNNQVQLAWFGGLSGVQARRAVRGSQAIAQGQEDLAFETFFIANTSTYIQRSDAFPAEIAGHTFTFGSKGSTSGRLMPEFFIRKQFKKPPEEVFRRVGFSGDHSKTLALVQSGAYQVGALNFKVWENELQDGNVDTTKVRVIWKTPSYPDYNWSIRGDVDSRYGKGFLQQVKKALLNLEDETILASFPRSRFIEARNAIYEPILKTAIEVGIIAR